MLATYDQYMKIHKQTRTHKFFTVGSILGNLEEVKINGLIDELLEFKNKHEDKDLVIRLWSDDDSYNISTGEIANDIGYYDLEPIDEYNTRCRNLYDNYVRFYNSDSMRDKRNKEIQELEEKLAKLKLEI
jgi:hypothetical protein